MKYLKMTPKMVMLVILMENKSGRFLRISKNLLAEFEGADYFLEKLIEKIFEKATYI